MIFLEGLFAVIWLIHFIETGTSIIAISMKMTGIFFEDINEYCANGKLARGGGVGMKDWEVQCILVDNVKKRGGTHNEK